MERRSNKKVYYNAQMSPAQVRQECQPDAGGKRILELAMTRLQLSARAYDRILKVARSIADLEHSEPIEQHHIAEAIQYRSLDKGSWGRR
jgi:magnesium chelatase family protein